ncbi:MAG: hypothetical protein IT228_12690 [Flavobacteriales bacterium]|nr:hypothetical protein [Flavobacteriales bacterium]MCC6578191.1 hypothetical protein [Flavobacteriales bacterium]
MQKVGDKPYKRVQDLLKALNEAERALGGGALNVAGLEQACDDARELYERLVVLRHKAREGERPHPPAAAMALAAEPPAPAAKPAPAPKPAPPPAATAPEPDRTPVIRLDTRPEVRQTSLIDAIAETETAPPQERADKPAATPTARPKSLADKLGEAPIPDLGKAIALSQKFWFVAELFGGDRVAFEQGVEAINAAKGLEEARRLVEARIAGLKKAPDPEALQAFLALVERRHR